MNIYLSVCALQNTHGGMIASLTNGARWTVALGTPSGRGMASVYARGRGEVQEGACGVHGHTAHRINKCKDYSSSIHMAAASADARVLVPPSPRAVASRGAARG